MSLREELAEELKEAVDEEWAEVIKLLPQSDGVPDANREPVLFDAVLRTGDRAVVGMQFGRSREASGGLSAEGGQLRINRSAYPELVIRQHDKIVAQTRHGAPIFEISQVDDRSHLRLICTLSEAR